MGPKILFLIVFFVVIIESSGWLETLNLPEKSFIERMQKKNLFFSFSHTLHESEIMTFQTIYDMDKLLHFVRRD